MFTYLVFFQVCPQNLFSDAFMQNQIQYNRLIGFDSFQGLQRKHPVSIHILITTKAIIHRLSILIQRI